MTGLPGLNFTAFHTMATNLHASGHTVTTRDRLALVTVTLRARLRDTCLRMLQPVELYKVQGFPGDYIINHGADGKPFTKTQQVHMCGNSVSPPPMVTLARANDPRRITLSQANAA